MGDFVEIQSDQHDGNGSAYKPWIMEVTELFEDVEVTYMTLEVLEHTTLKCCSI